MAWGTLLGTKQIISKSDVSGNLRNKWEVRGRGGDKGTKSGSREGGRELGRTRRRGTPRWQRADPETIIDWVWLEPSVLYWRRFFDLRFSSFALFIFFHFHSFGLGVLEVQAMSRVAWHREGGEEPLGGLGTTSSCTNTACVTHSIMLRK